MRYKNNVGPQVRRRRYALGWPQSDFAAKLQIAGFDISRSGVSKIEARLSYVDDKALLYLAEVLKVQVQELFPPRTPGNRLYDFMEKLETTRFLMRPRLQRLYPSAPETSKNQLIRAKGRASEIVTSD